ncbi:MAG: hypothetical protein RIR16_675 [Actinomycetota bacterium]|jgi:hypothetical protein
MSSQISLPDQQTAVDLQSYLSRAKRLDADGMVRFRAFGKILAAYVAPIFAGGLMDSGPTILGLRTLELAEAAELDVIVPIAQVLDRLAKVVGRTEGQIRIDLPASQRAIWAGVSPPRAGWQEIGVISEQRLTQIARDGIAEVAASLPESVGGPIAARVRGEIWGRGIDLETKLPTGAAFAAAGLGFLTEGENVGVYQADGWVRISAMHGHVISKSAVKFAGL